MKLNLIFNRNQQNIIGIDNELLFTIPNDLQWFKKHTGSHENEQNIVIMGLNTWLSLPKKPLPNRMNIILTKNHSSLFTNISNDNIKSFTSLESIFKYIQTINYQKIFVIGGSKLFDIIIRNYSFYIDCIYETFVHKNYIPKSNHFKYLDFKIDNRYQKIYEKKCNSEGKMYGHFKEKIDYTFHIYQIDKNINQNEIEYLQLFISRYKYI